MTPQGCSDTCAALTRAIEGMIVRTSEGPRFARDLDACAYKAPFVNAHCFERYERARYIASIARHAVTRQVRTFDIARVSRERVHVLELRKLDAMALGLERLARDRVMRPATAVWMIADEIQATRNSFTGARRSISALLARTQDVSAELQQNLAVARQSNADATAVALELIATVELQFAETRRMMDIASEALNALDIRFDVDVVENVPSKKRNPPGEGGHVPDLLLGQILLLLIEGADFTTRVDDPDVAAAIVATRRKYVLSPRERRDVVDDGGDDVGRDARYERAVRYANEVRRGPAQVPEPR